MKIRTAHTADLDAVELAAVRELLDDVFDGEFTDDDWDHTLGGVHALGWDGAGLVGHASVIQRRLLYGGHALRTGYVEAVVVHHDYRRRGHATALMHAMERVIRGAYQIGALSATDDALQFYLALGWQRWLGPAWALTPTGRIRTQDDDGGIFVLPVTVNVDPQQSLTCDWRDGDLW
jgi:aminoglycoside 2'-N-acetyltransferase I